MLFGCAVFSKKAVSPLCVGADACIGPPVGLAESGRVSVAARSRLQCRAGDLARRMGACAAAGLPGRCKHRPLRMRGRGPAGGCRIFPSQSGNAPLRLRLAAHPPPLTGEALGELPPERLPCKGSCRRQPTEGCRTLPCQCPSGSPQTSPAGVNARPTMLWQTGGIAGRRQTWRADDSHGVSPLCVGGDACISPRYSAGGCRFRVISRSRPQCRAGDLARRLVFAASQGFRDDASIVPYGCGGKALPGFAGYFRRKAAMHPSVGASRLRGCGT